MDTHQCRIYEFTRNPNQILIVTKQSLSIDNNLEIMLLNHMAKPQQNIITKMLSKMARNKKTNTHINISNIESESTSSNDYLRNTSSLISNCLLRNRQKCDNLMDQQFYSHSLQPKKMINQILPLQMSYHYMFRDYPALLTDLENQDRYLKKSKLDKFDAQIAVQKQLVQMRKILTLILSDKEQLQAYLAKKQKQSQINMKKNDNLMLTYAKGLGYLCIGEIQKGKNILLKILNSKSEDLIDGETIEWNINLYNPNLTFKDKICLNLLIVNAYFGLEQDKTNQIQQKPLDLYRKLKNYCSSSIKQKINLANNDFRVSDYEEFINLWLSSKYDQPLQWSDLSRKQISPYDKYLYILAENSYLSKKLQKTKEIIPFLNQFHPLRNFLELSFLYDNKIYQKLHEVAQKAVSNKLTGYMRMPQYDLLFYNILELGKKAAQNQMNKGLQGGLMEQQLLMKYQLNIDIQQKNKGIPHYYLMIPFEECLLVDQFREEVQKLR